MSDQKLKVLQVHPAESDRPPQRSDFDLNTFMRIIEILRGPKHLLTPRRTVPLKKLRQLSGRRRQREPRQ
jgi:hypothetical protein